MSFASDGSTSSLQFDENNASYSCGKIASSSSSFSGFNDSGGLSSLPRWNNLSLDKPMMVGLAFWFLVFMFTSYKMSESFLDILNGPLQADWSLSEIDFFLEGVKINTSVPSWNSSVGIPEYALDLYSMSLVQPASAVSNALANLSTSFVAYVAALAGKIVSLPSSDIVHFGCIKSSGMTA